MRAMLSRTHRGVGWDRVRGEGARGGATLKRAQRRYWEMYIQSIRGR